MVVLDSVSRKVLTYRIVNYIQPSARKSNLICHTPDHRVKNTIIFLITEYRLQRITN